MNTTRWAVTVPPTWEPLTLSEAKDHLRVDHSDEDAIIAELITAARQYLEGVLGRAIPQQTITAYYTCLWNLMQLPRAAPLQSVTSVKYLDTDGAEQTLSTAVYDVFTAATPGEVRLAYDQSWPTTRTVTDAVRVAYVAGWASGALVPAPIRQALLLTLGHWYENRETTSPLEVRDVPMSVSALVAAYKVRWA